MRGAIPARAIPVPREEAKTYSIMIKNNKFNPSNLKIEKGSIVEWRVHGDDDSCEESEFSLYTSHSRSHVVAFDNMMAESPMLKLDENYKVRFLEVGHFTF